MAVIVVEFVVRVYLVVFVEMIIQKVDYLQEVVFVEKKVVVGFAPSSSGPLPLAASLEYFKVVIVSFIRFVVNSQAAVMPLVIDMDNSYFFSETSSTHWGAVRLFVAFRCKETLRLF